jgi:ergothioneine biosynthesis protein EgtB
MHGTSPQPADLRASQDLASAWLARYREVRQASEAITASLSDEDCQLQSMPDASPAKWHLAHTSWFFETFLLAPQLPAYQAFDARFAVLFNSYYVTLGDRHPRPQRGLLSRPSRSEVSAYRRHVDAAMEQLISACSEDSAWLPLLELGLHHEQQHQELILMDIHHAFSHNPALPAADPDWRRRCGTAENAAPWHDIPAGLHRIGHAGPGFAFDNEGPAHRVWLEAYRIADRLVTNREFANFIAEGGYRRPELWLSDGWAAVAAQDWTAPLYWQPASCADAGWARFGPAGLVPLELDEPVLHVSYYEADAYARWTGARLPTEAEWEVAASLADLAQAHGWAWQWTASAYAAYPGFSPAAGAVGEYNGKFMINQMVLRGSAWATPAGHARDTYRNFFPPAARWAFSGIRLAACAPVPF